MVKKYPLVIVIFLIIALFMPGGEAGSTGRWVVCFRVDTIRGPFAINETCIRCALADSGGYSYAYPGSAGNVCGGSRGSNWKSFSNRTDAVNWIDRHCGCVKSGDLPLID
jgi:hypothetical protein